MSSNFGHIPLLTTELSAIEGLKNDVRVSTYSRLILIGSFLNVNLQVHVSRTFLTSWMSSNFG